MEEGATLRQKPSIATGSSKYLGVMWLRYKWKCKYKSSLVKINKMIIVDTLLK